MTDDRNRDLSTSSGFTDAVLRTQYQVVRSVSHHSDPSIPHPYTHGSVGRSPHDGERWTNLKKSFRLHYKRTFCSDNFSHRFGSADVVERLTYLRSTTNPNHLHLCCSDLTEIS